ncbi:glycosyltransferase [Sphingomonas nostoxanthinifaciens]|uniref:glycosyltransferase n=1 Tax=Sphingomonas nostoxanthinifaciens TaxID=2872652 RepID=UPI001CC21FB4|nr:glycosyltransferase [Sphingomonas nostoxanthinifaciens]UAK24614.1 glycosyltransferase [Sphingomonas nostoxanthinifaciens]
MRIVDVCAFYAPEGGGVRTYIERKLKAVPAAGHELIVLAPGRTDRIEHRGPNARIEWLASPRFPLDRRYGYFADAGQLHAALDRLRPDVVEVSSPWRSASIVADWQGPARRVLVMHADPLSAYAYRWFGGVADRATIDRGFAWFWRHLRRLDARYDAVVSASASLSERLTEGGLARVVTNPMGVDPGIFSPDLRDEELRARLLDRCGLPSSATLLLAVGRHAPEKRWPMVIDAAMTAAARRPVGLVLVGDGRDRGRIVRQIGANPHVCLVAPIRDRLRLATMMASADALIHGCEAETFCIVAAEARASGLPLIAPDAGGASDQARAGGGLTYRASSSASAAAAITRFVDQPVRATGSVRTMDEHFADLFALYEWLDQPAARAA